MKTIRTASLVALILALFIPRALVAGPDDDLQIRPGGCIKPQPNLEVYVWPDRGIDATYYPGDPIRIFFEVTRDCYVVLYDIDTRGRLHILFPFDPWQDNYVEAGRVYELPGDWDDFTLTVDGPPGTEYIQAIVSPYPFDLPDWPIYINSPGHYPATCPDPDLLDFRAGDDRIAYIHRVNRKLSRRHWDWCATDLARFYVRHRLVIRPDPYYPRPRIDPWPDVFYGEIYIGWPIGARIYIDGIYYGMIPCWIPRLRFGYHWISCYDGHRVVRNQRIRFQHKRAFRGDHPDYRIKGKHRREVYRTAPGKPVIKDERICKSRPPGKGKLPSKAIRKGRSVPKNPRGDRGVVTSKKAKPVRDVYRSPGTVKKAAKKSVAHGVKKAGQSKKQGGLVKLVSSLGHALGGKLEKSTSKKAKSAKRSAGELSGKSNKKSSGQAKAKKSKSTVQKKRR